MEDFIAFSMLLKACQSLHTLTVDSAHVGTTHETVRSTRALALRKDLFQDISRMYSRIRLDLEGLLQRGLHLRCDLWLSWLFSV